MSLYEYNQWDKLSSTPHILKPDVAIFIVGSGSKEGKGAWWDQLSQRG